MGKREIDYVRLGLVLALEQMTLTLVNHGCWAWERGVIGHGESWLLGMGKGCDSLW